MEQFSERRDLEWLPEGAVVRCLRTECLPPRELMSGVFALCFLGDRVLFIKHETRGWDVPGGHIEEDEDPIAALHRELGEEASAKICAITPFAQVEVDLGAPAPADYKYPAPKSYMMCFIAKIERLDPFEGKFETVERRLFTPAEARELEWVKKHSNLYEAALKAAAAL